VLQQVSEAEAKRNLNTLLLPTKKASELAATKDRLRSLRSSSQASTAIAQTSGGGRELVVEVRKV
jgi:hypothetical protein